MNVKLRNTALAMALGLALAGPAMATMADLPPVQHEGTVAFVSGGIGQTESRAMQQAAASWPMTLEFAVHDKLRNYFATDVQVQVRNSENQTVLDTASDGPFLLARLAPGRYTIDATLAGKTLQRKVTVGKVAGARVLFLWPSGTDEAARNG